MTYAVRLTNLTHHFDNRQQVLANIDLAVPEGSIYGFLGANGAGKSTTLKLILGLLKKQTGDIILFGQSIAKNRVEILSKVGAVIESPSLYEHLTATENLLVWQKIYQCPTKNIAEVLDLVGLAHTGSKTARNFSLGMKQRLGIAIALLHQPKLLILDEPTNGLDPNGMVEMRELIKQINQERGITIMISSHILAEIEKLVTDVGIIHKGKRIFQGSLPSLLQQKQATHWLKLTTNQDQTVATHLTNANYLHKMVENSLWVQVQNAEQTAKLVKALVLQGVEIHEVSPQNSDLESVFMNLIA